MKKYHEPQILDESDEDFDPQTEDIHQYCKIIGLDPRKDSELLWIAQEGICAKLEPPWKAINQEDVGIYYFNFETGDSVWEHPNDKHYRQKVLDERSKLDSDMPRASSPKLGPLRTPRTPDKSITNSLDFLKSSADFVKSSHDSTKGDSSKPVVDTYQDDYDDDSSSGSNNIQMDIYGLQPVKVPSNIEETGVDESSVSETKDSDSSFQIGAAKFLKGGKSVPNSRKPAMNPLEVLEDSASSFSKPPSLKTKSQSPRLSKSSSISSNKRLERNSPIETEVVPNSPGPKFVLNENNEIPEAVLAQIENKKMEAEIKIEDEMKQVQIELLSKRQKRYEEIMEAHETEMFRLEREAQKVNAEQEHAKHQALEKLRNDFETEMDVCIAHEKEQHNLTKESALNGLKASHTQEKQEFVDREVKNLSNQLDAFKADLLLKNTEKLSVLKENIEKEENVRIQRMNKEFLSKKHENERLADQTNEIFERLRLERGKIEKQNQEELVQLQEEHSEHKKKLLEKNNSEVQETKTKHLNTMSELHLKFESEIQAKKRSLEEKRREFDKRIEKYERDHSQRKMAWAEKSIQRSTELDMEASLKAKKRTRKKSTREDIPSARSEPVSVISKSSDNTPSHSIKPEGFIPASERLREYLNGLEKKLENVTSMIEKNSVENRTDRWSPTRRPASGYISSTQTQPERNSSSDYVSERWKAYFGTDFKYVPAKHELEQRTMNDYRYKETHDKLRDVIRTSSY